jgi:hypothetical protein
MQQQQSQPQQHHPNEDGGGDGDGPADGPEAAGLSMVLGSLQNLWQQGCHDASRLTFGIAMRQDALAAADAALASLAAASIQQPELVQLPPQPPPQPTSSGRGWDPRGAAAAAPDPALAAQAVTAAPPVRQVSLPLGVVDPAGALAAFESLQQQLADVGPGAAVAGVDARAQLKLRLKSTEVQLVGGEAVATARLQLVMTTCSGSSSSSGADEERGASTSGMREWTGAALRVTHASLLVWERRLPLAARSAWRWDAAAGELTVEAAFGLQQLLPLAMAARPTPAEDGSEAAGVEGCEGEDELNPYLEISEALAQAALGGGGSSGGSGSLHKGDSSGATASSSVCSVQLGAVVSAELLPALWCAGNAGAAQAPGASGVLLLEPVALPVGDWAAGRLGCTPTTLAAVSGVGAAGGGAAAVGAAGAAQCASLKPIPEEGEEQQQQQAIAGEPQQQDDGEFIIEESEVSDSPHPITLTQLTRAPTQQQQSGSLPAGALATLVIAPDTAAAAPGEIQSALRDGGGHSGGGPATGADRPALVCLREERYLLLRAPGGGAALAALPRVLASDVGFRPACDQQQVAAACAAAAAGRRARVTFRQPAGPGLSVSAAPAGEAVVDLLLHGCEVAEVRLEGGNAGELELLQAALAQAVQICERQQQQDGAGGGSIRIEPSGIGAASLAACAGAVDALEEAMLLHCRAIERALVTSSSSGGGRQQQQPSQGAAAAGLAVGDAGANRDQQRSAAGAAGTGVQQPGGKRPAAAAGGSAVPLVPSSDAGLEQMWLACLRAQADLGAAIMHLAAPS